MSETAQLPVIVIGAGPVGLAAAAHLVERGLTPLVLERGAQVGASIREWAHVGLFSPWEYNIDTASKRLLERHGWTAPTPDTNPTGGELVAQYVQPLADTPELALHIRTGARVIAVTRQGIDKMQTLGRTRPPPRPRRDHQRDRRRSRCGSDRRIRHLDDTEPTRRERTSRNRRT
jgi:cation diffusion facilitator CzcD-associated flavoprotein CzcO